MNGLDHELQESPPKIIETQELWCPYRVKVRHRFRRDLFITSEDDLRSVVPIEAAVSIVSTEVGRYESGRVQLV